MTKIEKTIEFFLRKAAMKHAAGYEEAEHYDTALSALRAEQERANPKPLTLDKLREMVGEPVYVISGTGAVCAYSGWALVGRYYDDTVALHVIDNMYYEPAIRHGTITVYDYPPKEARE